ncbi:MAG: carbohydrate-binding family 9-like protein [Acidobacteriota bacterium]
MTENDRDPFVIRFIEDEIDIQIADYESWDLADEIAIDKYWSGEPAPSERHCQARLLWSAKSFYARFVAAQFEPLVVSSAPNADTKTLNLWDRDVCEIFVAPDTREPGRYFEFEAAPTGEWVDLGIEATADSRRVDLEYVSGMKTASKVRAAEFVTIIQIPLEAFGLLPKPGTVWLGNLFRCVGSGTTRGYLAWRPTCTPEPNFHVPESFGKFVFQK